MEAEKATLSKFPFEDRREGEPGAEFLCVVSAPPIKDIKRSYYNRKFTRHGSKVPRETCARVSSTGFNFDCCCCVTKPTNGRSFAISNSTIRWNNNFSGWGNAKILGKKHHDLLDIRDPFQPNGEIPQPQE